ncbi:MAG TPA: 4Fe-4S dicluster domain-containing protein [Thermoplasmatales archaeon]|nr:4Fe-4S dicluster domain-containing protein [Thermoplasmatales archaeon]
MGKHKVEISQERCLMCGGCISVCPKDTIEMREGYAFVIKEKCIGCDICVKACPVEAIHEVVV